MAASTWSTEKARLASMSLEEKRRDYFCGEKFVSLNDIPTWREYFKENEKSLAEKVSEKDLSSCETGGNFAGLADKVSIFRGDITKLEIDAIVNAANESLLGGGGVDGAIHRGAGKLLLEECKTLHGCNCGEAKITSGYKLPSKNIIHTVGPRGEIPEKLKCCYQNSLSLLIENNLRSIAFPCISTGIFGYPASNAAKVALETVKSFLTKDSDKVDRVIFCLFLESDVSIYEKQMQLFFPPK